MYEKQSIVNLFVKEVMNRYNSKFEIKLHSDSKLLSFFKPLIKLINPTFFETTSLFLFNKLWVPAKFYDKNLMDILVVLSHELVHIYDKARFGGLFFYTYYLFPQIFSLVFLALSFIASFWFLIPAVICLAPIPAYMRYRFELRAYASSHIFNKHVYKVDNEMMDEFISHILSSRTYYFCWPFKSLIKKALKKGADENSAPYSEIIIFLRRYGFIKLS